MYGFDFSYDRKLLSEYGFVIGSVDSKSSSDETMDSGSQLTLNMSSTHMGARHFITSVTYKDTITYTFQITKDMCDTPSGEITESEFRKIMRWLNRKEFLEFYFVPDESDEIVYHFATFTSVKKIAIGGVLYGIELELTTSAPFGYGDLITNTLSISHGGTAVIEDSSDETGYIYPDMQITCKEDGQLIISSDRYTDNFVVSGCKTGEVISINGKTQIISSSLTSHKISNDFNFMFPRIVNSFTNRKNTFTSSLSVDIMVSYRPIIKNFA